MDTCYHNSYAYVWKCERMCSTKVIWIWGVVPLAHDQNDAPSWSPTRTETACIPAFIKKQSHGQLHLTLRAQSIDLQDTARCVLHATASCMQTMIINDKTYVWTSMASACCLHVRWWILSRLSLIAWITAILKVNEWCNLKVAMDKRTLLHLSRRCRDSIPNTA